MHLLTRVKDVVRSLIGDLPNRVRRRRRIRELAASQPILSSERLVTDLDRLPVRQGTVVLVHSSLKALGFVTGGAEAVVEALIKVFVERRDGTFMLPTFSIDGSMHQTLTDGGPFDLRSTPSNLGAIPEAFRRHPKAKRSLHPTHSLAAIGSKAGWLVEGHHLAGTSFGDGSPMANMLAADGYLLGLGTDLGRVTFYHCLEEIEDDFPIDVFTPDSPIDVACYGHHDQVHRLSIKAHDRAPAKHRIDQPDNTHLRSFFQHRFEDRAGLSWHQIGEAPSWLIEAKKLYAEIKGLMQAGITIYSSPKDLELFRQRDDNGSDPE
ncbi:MAG: AAC(3) family N-acetyltransferase [Geminicoccaceae bacterium]